MNFKGRSLISIHDLTKEDILHILKKAKELEDRPQPTLLQGKLMASMFFEPSTRTKLSFEAAMTKLGGGIVGFASGKTSSTSKGESLSDSVRTVEQYSDIIVIRHNLDGAARLARDKTNIPVINGGDGSNQHPTQTLLDLYTIMKTQGKLDGLKVALVGDLKYGRTVHSLAMALRHFGCELHFVAPEALKMPDYITAELEKAGVKYTEHEKIEEVVKEVDILYMTRIQRERFPDDAEYEKVKNVYVLNKSMLEGVKSNLKVMHPLPRVNEIALDVDDTESAESFEQAGNGIPVRQAIMALALGAIK